MNDQKMTDKYFRKAMATSIVCIVVCMMCLASLTWAWYSASVQSSSNTLVAASFITTTQVVDANGEPVDTSNPLPAGKYTATVTQEGTARTGYCLVAVNQTNFYAGSFIPGTDGNPIVTFTFTVKDSTENGVVERRELPFKIIPVWGIYTRTDLNEFPSEIVGTQSLSSVSVASLDADGAASASESTENIALEDTTTASESETTEPEDTTDTSVTTETEPKETETTGPETTEEDQKDDQEVDTTETTGVADTSTTVETENNAPDDTTTDTTAETTAETTVESTGTEYTSEILN